ncbi:MAG: Gfo/Idh/MocA family oxidoreductase [Candidatus Atribacteria bacterium]|nr:Gfo/Idh/MocA family oxidoreductase [Candidatus Atribacteria bacterium]
MIIRKIFNFGIIGTGQIAHIHYQALKNIHNARLIAIQDINLKTAMNFARKYKIKQYYKNYLDLLKNKKIDVVIICTPHWTHEEIGINAAKFGKHVLIEKPLANTAKSAENIINSCKKNNVKLGVIFQNRFSNRALKLKSYIQRGKLGKIVVANVLVNWHRTQEYYNNAPWRAFKSEAGGGVLMTQAIHFIDLLQWCIGQPESVYAYTDVKTHNIEVEDTAVAVLRFKSGILGIIESTVSTYPELPAQLCLYGSKGIAILEEHRGKIKLTILPNNEEEKNYKIINYKKMFNGAIPKLQESLNHQKQIEDFIESIYFNKKPEVDGREGIKSLKIIESIYRSSNRKEEVKLN